MGTAAPMRIGMIGFGRAGQAVCTELMRAPDTEVAWVLRRDARSGPEDAEAVVGQLSGRRTPLLGFGQTDLPALFEARPVDFVVDFSAEPSCLAYAGPAARAGVGIISAISGYDDHHLDCLREAAGRSVVLYSPNITVGINFVMLAAKVLRRLAPHADVEIIEEHFRGKREVSGTARRIARALDLDERAHINSVRVGGIVGRHEVVFGFPYQTLRLVHDSISRNAFGQGVLFALRALRDRAPGYYTMEQLVAEQFADAVEA